MSCSRATSCMCCGTHKSENACTGDPSFLESVDIYFDKAASLASTTPDILTQIKVASSSTIVIAHVH